MTKRILSFLILLLIFNNTYLSAENNDSCNVDKAWNQLAKNNFDAAEILLENEIDNNPSNSRAYLALSYIYQLKEKNVVAWKFYSKALKNLENPNPYIFASFLTNRGLISPDVNTETGLSKLLPDLIDGKEETGVLEAGAIEWMGRINKEYGDLDEAIKYFDQLNAISDWTIIGPFENISASGFDKEFKPEIEYDWNREYKGKKGVPVKWFGLDEIRHDYWIDFTRHFAHTEAIYFANTFVYSPKKQNVDLRIGTSGSMKTFLNDVLVMEYSDENNNDLDTYIVETELQKGWNRLLVKCGFSEITQCNFLMRITDIGGNKIDDLKYSIKKESYPSKPKFASKSKRNFAELYFEDQIRKYPNRIENYLLIADCYLRNDKAIEAELYLKDAAEKMPDCVLIKSLLVEAFVRGEKYDESASIIKEIFNLYSDVPFIIEQKFNEYDSNQNLEKAEEMFVEYERLLPGSVKSMLMDMAISVKKGQMEQAITILNNAFEKYPNSWDLAFISAIFSVRSTQSYDQAIKIYSDYLEFRRTDNAFVQLADAYFKDSKIDEVEETFKKFFQNDPAVTGIYFKLATVFQQLQNYEKAKKYINKSIQLCPGFSTYWSKLGEILLSSGDSDGAINAFNTALEYSATDYYARERLRELQGKVSVFSQFEKNDIKELLKKNDNPKNYVDQDAAIILDDQKRVVYDKGASETESELLVKLLNVYGIDSFKEYWVPYNSYSQKLIVEKAVVYKTDGTEINADINDNQLVFKSLEVNDHIYIKWQIQNFNQGRLSEHIWENINFNLYYPVETMRYSILSSDNFKFYHRTQNMDDNPRIINTPDGDIFTWELKEQPAIDYEDNMPTLDDVGKVLFISSIPNWEYVVDWYLDLARTKTQSSYEIKEKVKELLENKSNIDELEKIRIVYQYITENIRYSSISFRQSGLIPQKARTVLIQKIGDCKDVATLCISMLHEAGISAHYVLVNTFDEGENKNALPSINFNHVVVGAETDNGIIYMDLTAQNYPLLSIPKADRDAFVLSIIPGNKNSAYLSYENFQQGLTKRVSEVKLSSDNSAVIERTSIKYGVPGAYMRDTFRFMSKKEQIEKIGKILANEHPNVKVNKFSSNGINDLTNPVKFDYEFIVPHFLEEASTIKLFKIPWGDYLESRRSLSSETRKYDYLYRATSDTLMEEITIYLPEGYEVIDIDDKVQFESDGGQYLLTMQYEKGVIKANRKMINKKSIISPEQYPEFREFYNKVVRSDSRQIVLKKII